MAEIKLVNVEELQALPRTQLTVADVPAEHVQWYHRSNMDFNKDLNLKGKYCYHPFNTVTIDSQGECYVCTCQAWLPISVGNILDFNSLQEIVQSPKAREIQASIIDGTYKYCDHHTCHIIKGNMLEGRVSHRPDNVNWIVFAIDDSCNLSCPSCRTDLIFHNKGSEFEFRMRLADHITKLIQNHKHFLKFTLSGDGDPFASHVYRHILQNLQLTKEHPVEIEICTNGIMVRDHWDKMSGVHNNVIRFKISFDAGSPEVYKQTRRGGDWDKLLESAKHIVKWKQKNYSNMEVVANFVVQNLNYHDIHNYVQIAKEIGFDEIAFQKVTDWGKWNINGINYFSEHAVWMENHPNHWRLVEILNDPIMKDRKIELTNLSHLVKNKNNSLSELVKLKTDTLVTLNTSAVYNELTKLKDELDILSRQMQDYTGQYQQSRQFLLDIESKLNDFSQSIIQTTSRIDTEVTALTQGYHTRGYKINGYTATNRSDYTGEMARIMPMRADSIELVASQISKYVDWKYPGLEIGPGDGTWTPRLVACEPLYLVDIHQQSLDSTVIRFGSEYQKRLCTYVTSETSLKMLPQNQIGFVFSWNVFNYLTLDLIDSYLSNIFEVLRPGGVAMFSYNNAERYHCARNVEIGFMSYVPKKLLLDLVKKHCFELLSSQDIDDYVSWIEIRKPGELSTIKAHSPMGIIMSK